MAKRISILVALDGADDGLKRAISSAERSLGELSSSAKTAGDKAAAGMAEMKAGMNAFKDSISSAKTQLLAFLTISWAADKARDVVQVADAWAMMSARLKLATAGSNEYTTAQRELFAIAQRIGVPINETATLYGKLQQAVRQLGGEQQEALGLTESISQALRISGASASESQSALLQFGQALSAGVLRGEEFNSVVENSPRLAKALADGLNVPIGRLRKLAEEGRLTADVVIDALMSQKDVLAAEYSQLPQTVSAAFTRLSNAFGQWISRVDESTGFTTKLAEALTWLAENLDTVMQWFTRLAEVGLAILIYRMIPALIIAWQTAGAAAVTAATTTSAAWAAANLSLSDAIATVGKLRVAFAVLAAAVIGWEIGTWLREKFAIVRVAGVAMVHVLMRGIEELQYQWESFAAIFTGDTMAAASERHRQRLAEMNQIFAEMYADAQSGTEGAKAAMNTAATAAEEIARRMEAVRQGTQEAVGRGIEAVHGAVEKLKSRLGEVEQAAGKASGTVNDAVAKMGEAYKGLSGLIGAELQTQIAAVKARYAAEQAELTTTRQSERDRMTQGTQLLTDALKQQASLRQQATTQVLALIDQESQARRDAATRQGVTEEERRANVQRVENDILATKRQTLTQALGDYRQHIDALNVEANRHLAEIQRIENAKRQLTMTTEERIRDIRRQTMSDYEATEDRKRQIAELQQKARAALAAGEFEQSRQFAQKAMDLAVQVANTQSSEAKRGEQARQQSEQTFSQIVQLESQARQANHRREFDTEAQLLQQAGDLRAQMTNKAREADRQIRDGKNGVRQSIDEIRESESLLNDALDAEARAHRTAADTATSARNAIQRTLADTQSQIDDLTAKLRDGFKITLDSNTERFDKALNALDASLREKEYLIQIQADIEEAETRLREYEQLLKEGKTLPVDADFTQAQQALDRLKAYAVEHSQFDLKVSTEKAEAAVTNVERQIASLNDLQTQSRHLVEHNADAARAQVMSLNGANTSSTHTIYVTKVETNATGGVVGAGVARFVVGAGVARFADGGNVASPLASLRFPRMTGGTVPGSGDGDTVPRALDAGAFVIRKAAVRKYGIGALARLGKVARFAEGGSTLQGSASEGASPKLPWQKGYEPPKRNKDVVEALKLVELGYQGMMSYVGHLVSRHGLALSPSFRFNTEQHYGKQKGVDTEYLRPLESTKTLTGVEQSTVGLIKNRWRSAMAQALLTGKDLERELISYMESLDGQFFARGGIAASDTVPALLTPGEYVVNRATVQRLGIGFFEAINRMAAPAKALAGRTLAGVQGFATGGFVQPAGMAIPRPALVADGAPTRTVRVELAAGGQKVTATLDARDESRLLQLLDSARSRSL